MTRRTYTEREVAQILADSSVDLTDWRECLDAFWERGIRVSQLPAGAWLSCRNWALELRQQAALARQQERALVADSIPLRRATIADRDHRHVVPAIASFAAILALVVEVLR